MATVTDCNWTFLPSLPHFLSKLTFKNSVEYGFRLWFAQRAGTISINSSKRSHLDVHMFKKRNWYYWFWGLWYIIVFFLKVPYMNLVSPCVKDVINSALHIYMLICACVSQHMTCIFTPPYETCIFIWFRIRRIGVLKIQGQCKSIFVIKIDYYEFEA